jgi:hypothetical protein
LICWRKADVAGGDGDEGECCLADVDVFAVRWRRLRGAGPGSGVAAALVVVDDAVVVAGELGFGGGLPVGGGGGEGRLLGSWVHLF